MGFKLINNFNRPYFSRSISEFWKRWHISLSTWFKDYLYISLGGNRMSVPRWYLNLFIVFVISGLWHGANWTFIIWGAINGFYLVFAIVTQSWRKTLEKWLYLDKSPTINNILKISSTFLLACFAWIFFRANTINDAINIIKEIYNFDGTIFGGGNSLKYCFLAISILLIIELAQEYKYKSILPFKTKYRFIEHLAYSFLIIIILLIGVFDGSQFIYFQF